MTSSLDYANLKVKTLESPIFSYLIGYQNKPPPAQAGGGLSLPKNHLKSSKAGGMRDILEKGKGYFAEKGVVPTPICQLFQIHGGIFKCIEARELIIALPENYTKFDPDTVFRDFTDQFKKRYGVECASALHHNKTRKNYHIHLIFSERRLLDEPEIKIASRAVYYDESGKRVRTKKEITGKDGNIREGCIVIKKGEVYGQHLFTSKEEAFKSRLFLKEVKQFYQWDMAEWERQTNAPTEKPQHKSVLAELRRLDAEVKRQPRRPKPKQHQMDARERVEAKRVSF